MAFVTISNKAQVLRALRTAKRRIQNGWTRNTSMRKIAGRKHYCATGALERLSGGHEALSVIRSVVPNGVGPTIYNDTVAKRKSDVVRLYDSAIRVAKTGRFVSK